VGRKVREFETPGYPGKVLEKSTDEDANIAETMFRSLLGRIQYFQTKIGPTICNATCENWRVIYNTQTGHTGELWKDWWDILSAKPFCAQDKSAGRIARSAFLRL
jgi:hypothetical protein